MAVKTYLEAKVEALEKDLNETKAIAISARDKSFKVSNCRQEETLKNIKSTIATGRNLKFGAVIGFVVICASVIAQYYSLKGQADRNTSTVESVQIAVQKISADVQDVSAAVDLYVIQQPEVDAIQLQAISKAVTKAVEDANREKPRSKGHRFD